MVTRIKNSEVAGIVTPKGKCPSCMASLLNRDKDYTAIRTRLFVRYNNGEQYIKCKCSKFVMLPRMVA